VQVEPVGGRVESRLDHPRVRRRGGAAAAAGDIGGGDDGGSEREEKYCGRRR
jgi:hypothetical protein